MNPNSPHPSLTSRLHLACRALIALACAVAWALPAGAVIIDSGDGTGNVNAPGIEPDDPPGVTTDPGWNYVGRVNGLSGVYLRNRWVLTANHVGAGNIELGGVTYNYIPGTAVQLSNGDGTFPDLLVFAIATDPGLPELTIRGNAGLPGGTLFMIGYGKDRGIATDSDDPAIWNPPPPPPVIPIPGWQWGGSHTKRWGRNVAEGFFGDDPLDTVSFATFFDAATEPNHVEDEGHGAEGDSGGAVFAKQGPNWELAGIMIFNVLEEGHLDNSSLLTEMTGIAHLPPYKQQILDLTAVPEPTGNAMLGAGAALLGALGRRRAAP